MNVTFAGRRLAVAMLLLTGCVAATAAPIIEEPFLGIRHVEEYRTLPRPLAINVVEIDLSAPGLSFQVTPQGPAPQPQYLGSPAETLVQTTRQYANEQGAQVAINASFFAAIHSGGWTNNLGLTASNGNAYSPWELPSTAGFDDALNITAENLASIVSMPASIPTGFETNPPATLYNTVTGSHRLLLNGTNVAPAPNTGDSLTQLHPRTAAGVTADNKLVLLTVDGRQTGYSEGVTLVELADLLASYGAVNAINLDGGGSTTMAFNYYGDLDEHGDARAARLINSPVGNSNVVSSERQIGANLAVFAAPNPAFTPASSALAPSGNIVILDNFDFGEGHFASDPTTSGSTYGVSSNSRIDRVLNESFLGEGSQRLVIQSSDPGTPGLGLRHLSGGGSPAANSAFAADGYVGFFLKLHGDTLATGDVQVSLLLDDGLALESGIPLDIIADGGWHLYQWNLDDMNQWNSFFNGDGQLDAASVTIDSLWFSADANLDFTVFLDVVGYNNAGDLSALVPVPEPGSGLALGVGVGLVCWVGRRWRGGGARLRLRVNPEREQTQS